MPLSDDEYTDVLLHLRRVLREHGLGSLESLGLSSSLYSAEGPYYELWHFLHALIEELSLGSNSHYRSVMQRIRENVESQAPGGIRGIRVDMTPQEVRLYHLNSNRPYLELGRTRRTEDALSSLLSVLRDLEEDWRSRSDEGPRGDA